MTNPKRTLTREAIRMTELSKKDHDALNESYTLVLQSFRDAEHAVKNGGKNAHIEVLNAHSRATTLLSVMRKHLGLIP